MLILNFLSFTKNQRKGTKMAQTYEYSNLLSTTIIISFLIPLIG